jgi:glycosyltransferase involved in cell wall biosynthesis
MTNSTEPSRRHVLVVGPGTQFLSGVSYYTWQVVRSLSAEYRTSAILLDNLLPKVFYPGRRHVGKKLTSIAYDCSTPTFDGIDWWWIPSIFKAIRFLIGQRPNVVLLQWWTGAVAHSYLALAVTARLLGSSVVIEFHEAQDVGEARLPLARRYVRLMMHLLLRLSAGIVVHSDFDSDLIDSHYSADTLPRTVIPHGPFDQHGTSGTGQRRRDCPDDAFNILFFGVIRPFKGLEYLVEAFGSLSPDEVSSLWLTVVGETWEGWALPSELIYQHPYRDRITFANRYATDEELAGWLAGADLVVLPYLRSSASGPLHTTMSLGLPVVTTLVGGLPEAAGDYEGATFVEPGDSAGIRRAIIENARQGAGRRYADPHSWDRSRERYVEFFNSLEGTAHRS